MKTNRNRWITTASVSERMKRIRSSQTGLELCMRRILRRAGIRFRSQPAHFGKPDFRIVGTNILIFCDSSFWHGRGFTPDHFSRNRSLWVEKIKRNIRRDHSVNRVLRSQGWSVLRFRDSEIRQSPDGILRAIRRAMSGTRFSSSNLVPYGSAR